MPRGSINYSDNSDNLTYHYHYSIPFSCIIQLTQNFKKATHCDSFHLILASRAYIHPRIVPACTPVLSQKGAPQTRKQKHEKIAPKMETQNEPRLESERTSRVKKKRRTTEPGVAPSKELALQIIGVLGGAGYTGFLSPWHQVEQRPGAHRVPPLER